MAWGNPLTWLWTGLLEPVLTTWWAWAIIIIYLIVRFAVFGKGGDGGKSGGGGYTYSQ